jgi:hypothetical protein
MRFCASLLSISMFCLAGCGQDDAVDYGFAINDVSVSTAYQSLNVHLQQDIELSEQAREALEHGVTLILRLELELRNDDKMIVVQRSARHFQLRYLPLTERYQLSKDETGESRTFLRLRHLFASVDGLNIHLSTGPLPSGSYELRTPIRQDEIRFPAPKRLPAWFSAQWQHD